LNVQISKDETMKLRAIALVTAAASILAGCVTPPMGPTIPVMPGPNKPFASFQEDDATCQGFASQRVAGGADAANNKAIGEAVLGTALGAGLGAALGGGRGAAIGAGSGAIVGTAVGSDTSAGAQYGLQRQYNIAYAQCMSSKGDKVQWGPRRAYYGPPPGAYPPPPGAYPYPPPPGAYPPPAPGN
jgi:YMGG-like Gly-zipper